MEDFTFTADVAKDMSFVANQEYENNCKRFSNLKEEDIDDFKKFVLNEIKKNAKIGCVSLEFEMNNDLIEKKGVVDFFISLGYTSKFYKLNQEYSNAGYCLLISWY